MSRKNSGLWRRPVCQAAEEGLRKPWFASPSCQQLLLCLKGLLSPTWGSRKPSRRGPMWRLTEVWLDPALESVLKGVRSPLIARLLFSYWPPHPIQQSPSCFSYLHPLTHSAHVSRTWVPYSYKTSKKQAEKNKTISKTSGCPHLKLWLINPQSETESSLAKKKTHKFLICHLVRLLTYGYITLKFCHITGCTKNVPKYLKWILRYIVSRICVTCYWQKSTVWL